MTSTNVIAHMRKKIIWLISFTFSPNACTLGETKKRNIQVKEAINKAVAVLFTRIVCSKIMAMYPKIKIAIMAKVPFEEYRAFESILPLSLHRERVKQ